GSVRPWRGAGALHVWEYVLAQPAKHGGVAVREDRLGEAPLGLAAAELPHALFWRSSEEERRAARPVPGAGEEAGEAVRHRPGLLRVVDEEEREDRLADLDAVAVAAEALCFVAEEGGLLEEGLLRHRARGFERDVTLAAGAGDDVHVVGVAGG